MYPLAALEGGAMRIWRLEELASNISVPVAPGSPASSTCNFASTEVVPIPTLPVKKLNSDAANCRTSLALLASFKADILKSPDASSNSKLWSVLVFMCNFVLQQSW